MHTRHVGKYEILEEIGRGGFGTVYRARDTMLDRVVALKVLHPQLLVDPTFLTRFQQEARTAAGLKHPHIVTIHELGETEGVWYIAMEFLEGRPLDRIIRDEGRLEAELTLSIARDIGAALDYAHNQGLVHRDVKPSNILVRADGHATLTDFGLVQAALTSTVSTTMGLVGTPAYMSPEQCEGEELDGRSDLYALGVVLYEMLTGRAPFQADTPLAVMRGHADKAPPLPRTLNPDLPKAVEAVLLRALTKGPDERYQSGADLSTALVGALGLPVEPALPEHRQGAEAPDTTSLQAGERTMPAGLPRWIWVAAVVALLVLVALVFLIAELPTGQSLRPTPPTPRPTTVPLVAAQPTREPASVDSWEHVKALGKIVVGTAVDYPPFEYYIEELTIDGFDIALMDEIGRRLGVQVEYRDFAFDGLGGALQLGQVDAAIAGISVEPERESHVDFTSVYLVGEDATLAREDLNITLSSVDEMAQYKIGVERGSVYQGWLQTILVDTGKMAAGNLLVYEEAGDAIRDLMQERLDLVVLDLQIAEVAVAGGGVQIIAHGLSVMRYAIALPKGAESLRMAINRVLTDLHSEGAIAKLAKRYLNVDRLLPTPTPAATSTAAPPPGCVDGLTFMGHPDGRGSPDNPIQGSPGQWFTKVWRVKNTGTCTWDSNYELVFVVGARMSDQPTPVQGRVAPGQEYDAVVDMVVPQKSDTYHSIWQMTNSLGMGFGERLKVSVIVIPGLTVTPTLMNTP